MKSLLVINHNGDLYEITVDGSVITRIVRYFDGSTLRNELKWSDLSEEVQDKIVNKFHADNHHE